MKNRMPVFLPSRLMKSIPSTMSFLHEVGGNIAYNAPDISNGIIRDPTNEIEWLTINSYITPKYTWNEYISTVQNIRIYKGITSTLKVVIHLSGQLKYVDEIGDDPVNSEEWNSIAKYMTPKISWETYTSTIHGINTDIYFNELPYKIQNDLQKCEQVFSIVNETSINDVSDYVVYKRKLTNFLSSPCVLLRDRESTIQSYPKEPIIQHCMHHCLN